MSEYPGLNEDFVDLLRCLQESHVEFLVVGAHAMAVHGVPRATGDLDVLVRPSEENAGRLMAALSRFGAPMTAHGVRKTDFTRPGTVYQIGLPPRRIDLLTTISGVSFDEAWRSRTAVSLDDLQLDVLGRDALLANERATGRPKDVLDAKLLEGTDDEST